MSLLRARGRRERDWIKFGYSLALLDGAVRRGKVFGIEQDFNDGYYAIGPAVDQILFGFTGRRFTRHRAPSARSRSPAPSPGGRLRQVLRTVLARRAAPSADRAGRSPAPR